jgi:hypothetical protein
MAQRHARIWGGPMMWPHLRRLDQPAQQAQVSHSQWQSPVQVDSSQHMQAMVLSPPGGAPRPRCRVWAVGARDLVDHASEVAAQSLESADLGIKFGESALQQLDGLVAGTVAVIADVE